MVQSEGAVGLRARTRASRREELLGAAQVLIGERGVDGLTVKGVADRLDCAVGTIYTYFPSKGALLAAVQCDAIGRLGAAYDAAAAGLEAHLVGLDVDTAALARLVAFGRSVVAAEEILQDDYRLQQGLLGGFGGYDDDDLRSIVPVAFELLASPERLLRDAATLGVVTDGDAFERTVCWMAAVNGVLALASIRLPGEDGFATHRMADRTHLDLLAGWGADPARLAEAAEAAPLALVRSLLGSGSLTGAGR